MLPPAGNEDMHKRLDEFVFRPVPTLTPELSALERLKNLCIMLIPLFCAFIFDRIFVILAGKETSHKSLDEFKFSPDPFSDCGVSCL